ncbi:hypothetical protein Aperf_G00000040848 [Anoplocephala perfoliata]
MATQFYSPHLRSSAPYRVFRVKDPNISTLQRRRQLQQQQRDSQMLSSSLLCTSMTLQPPVTSFRARTNACSSVPSTKNLKISRIRPSDFAVNQIQTTSFTRKPTYISPPPSPVESPLQSDPPMKRIPSPLIVNNHVFPSPISMNREGTKLNVQSTSSQQITYFTPLHSSFKPTVAIPILSSENEEEAVKSPTSPCKSILRRTAEEMEEKLVTHVPIESGQMETPVPICFSRSPSIMSRKGVRFDVKRNSTHTYEREAVDGILMNGVKKHHFTRLLFQQNPGHKAD